MSKTSQFIEKSGVVLEKLPDAKFLIRLDDEDNNAVGYLSGRMQKAKIKVLAGDRVKLEFSPYDASNGRIVFRFKTVREVPNESKS